jgi:hypothetical protein
MSNEIKKTVLGSFGAAVKEAEKVQEEIQVFDFYGEEIELSADISVLPFMKLAALMEAGELGSEWEAMAAMYDVFKTILTPTSFNKFYKQAVDHKAGQDIFIEILQFLFSGVQGANRPLEQDSASTAGQSPTGKPTKQKSSNKSMKHSKQLEKAAERKSRRDALAAQLAELDSEENSQEEEVQETSVNPLDAPLTRVTELSQMDWAEIKGASVMGAGK